MSTTTVRTQTQTQITTTLQTPKFLSPSCQTIISESFSSNQAHLLIRSRLDHPLLWPSILQHLCNGCALVSSGHYADMAFVVGGYVWRAYRGTHAENPGINVGNMEVTKTYIAAEPQPPEGQWLEMEVQLDVPDCSCGDIIDASTKCTFRKINPDGKKVEDLATCTISFEFHPSWLASWCTLTPTILSRISSLQTDTTSDIQILHTKRAYDLFRTFVSYGPLYQNMHTIHISPSTLTATSLLALQPIPETDYTTPFYLDASCHISGFVCNTADSDMKKNAWISHGFKAMKLSPLFFEMAGEKGREMRNYVRMKPLPDDETVLGGDVYVLLDGVVVGCWEDVRFKRIPRRILNVFLPPRQR